MNYVYETGKGREYDTMTNGNLNSEKDEKNGNPKNLAFC